jgi:hypothetical protein
MPDKGSVSICLTCGCEVMFDGRWWSHTSVVLRHPPRPAVVTYPLPDGFLVTDREYVVLLDKSLPINSDKMAEERILIGGIEAVLMYREARKRGLDFQAAYMSMYIVEWSEDLCS